MLDNISDPSRSHGAGNNRLGIGFLGDENPDEILSHVRLAEQLGIESVWICETRFVRDSFTFLSAISQITTRMKLATAVVNPFTRTAVLTAVALATLDQLSNGRAILGIGVGSPEILRRQGLSYAKPMNALKETIEIIRLLLTGERVSYSGLHSAANEVKLDIQPYRNRIPVYAGVTGPRMLQFAGTIADGVLLDAPTSIEYAQRAIRHVFKGARQAGRSERSIDVAACIHCAISEHDSEAKDMLRPMVATYLTHFPELAQASGFAKESEEIRTRVKMEGLQAALPLVHDDLVSSLTAAGTTTECISRLDDYARADVGLPVIFPHGSKLEVEHIIRICAQHIRNHE